MKLPSVPRVTLIIWAAASVLLVILGLFLHVPLTGMTTTLVLIAAIVAVRFAPVVASVVFVAAFAFVATSPGLLGLVDAVLVLGFCGWIAYRRPVIHVAILVVLLGMAGLYDPTAQAFITEIVAIVVWFGQLCTVALIGWGIRRWQRARREMAEDLKRRRRDIARALHDSVASSLTSVVIKAEVLGLARGNEDDEITRQLQQIAEESRRSMQQVRQLITILDSPERDDVVASIESLSTVLEKGRSRLNNHGFRVVPAKFVGAELPVVLAPESVALVDRFLKEVATNALKYAPPASEMAVHGSDADGFFVLSVTNEVPVDESAPDDLSSGLGLRNLRGDASALGGTVEAGKDGQTWTTTLRLPA